MPQSLLLDRRKLQAAFSEIEDMRDKLPEATLAVLAQEVVKRVANNMRVSGPHEVDPTPTQIDALCTALVSADASAAITLIEQAQKGGASYDALCLSYLTIASRRLGE